MVHVLILLAGVVFVLAQTLCALSLGFLLFACEDIWYQMEIQIVLTHQEFRLASLPTSQILDWFWTSQKSIVTFPRSPCWEFESFELPVALIFWSPGSADKDKTLAVNSYIIQLLLLNLHMLYNLYKIISQKGYFWKVQPKLSNVMAKSWGLHSKQMDLH